MNSCLWILQMLLAAHTVIGAVWKFSNSAQTVPPLAAIPHAIWLALIGVELVCALCLVIPLLNRRLGILAPFAAVCIAIEMLMFSVVNTFSANPNADQMIYWLVVAAICAFIAFGRFVRQPIITTPR